MQDAADAAPSGMVSVLGLERDKIEELCDQAREGDVLQDRQPALPRQHRRLRQQAGVRSASPHSPKPPAR